MNLKSICALALCLALTQTQGHAQTTAPAFDLQPYFAQFGNESDADAVSKLKTLPPVALPSVYSVLQDPNLAERNRRLLRAALPEIFKKSREKRAADYRNADNAVAKASFRAYHDVGEKNDAWDAAAMDAFLLIQQDDPQPSQLDIYNAFKKPVDAGCTDPLVRYYYATRGLNSGQISPSDALPLLEGVAADMEKSRYSPNRTFYAYYRLMLLESRFNRNADAALEDKWAKNYRKILDLLSRMTPERTSPIMLRDAMDFLYANCLYSPEGHQYSAEVISPILLKLLPKDGYGYAFAARAYIDWAWDARGNGWADSVTPQGWELFSKRISEAKRLATLGSQIDPVDDRCPTDMITICTAQSADRSTMEEWFQHAMLANPDNYYACTCKAMFLQPKWGGSLDDLLTFGRECVATGTRENHIAHIMVDIHVGLANDSDRPWAYFADPIVWKDLESSFKKLLTPAENPTPDDHATDRYYRAEYLLYAGKCEQWTRVAELVQEFHDDIDMSHFGGRALYDVYLQRAANKTTIAPK